MTATWTTPRTWATGEVVTAAQLNQYLRDELDWLKGRPAAYESDFDGTFFSTTSSSFQDTGANAALTTTGGRVMVVCFGSVLTANSTTQPILTLYQDGANMGDATLGMTYTQQGTAGITPFAIVYITPTAPTAAAHEWKVYMRSLDNVQAATIKQYQMWAIEIGA